MKRKVQQTCARRKKKPSSSYPAAKQFEDDRISSLPDELCSYILSMLPTADAVKTSLLSTRWRHMWTTVTSFDFDFLHFPKSKGRSSAFTEFINRALITHDGLDIQRFRLRLPPQRGGLPYASVWITFAIRHYVEELELCIPRMTLEKLPNIIFSCESLRILKLDLPGNTLELPSSMCLSKLLTLSIVSVCLNDANVTSKLISSCPVLENLNITDCSLHGLKILNICAPQLKNLQITRCYRLTHCDIKISAPNLHSFKYCSDLAHDFSLEKLSTLREVSIDFHGYPGYFYYFRKCKKSARKITRILHGLDNVENLVLSARFIEHLVSAIDILGSLSCRLHNVRHLDLTMWCDKSYIKVIVSLLQCCSSIESLFVTIDGKPPTPWEQDTSGMPLLPGCPLKKLRTVMMKDCEGVNKLNLVRFLIKNAKSLEKIVTISSDGEVKENKMSWTGDDAGTFGSNAENILVV